MLCPSCGHDNLEGVDRCDECLTPLLSLDVPRAEDTEGLARSVMEDNLSQIEHEFLGVASGTQAIEVIKRMREAHLGCALVLDGEKLVGIFTEHDVLKKMTGPNAIPPTSPVDVLMTRNPETLRETDSVAAGLNKMSLGRYRHLPVQKADRSYAVVSIKHVLKYIAQAEW
jgi:predicted transcriptional regulator